MSEKTNITLRIDKNVVDKARKLGLNLSSITESMLKTENFIEDGELVTPEKIREVYRKIFIKICDIIGKWGVSLKIGSGIEEVEFKDHQGNISFGSLEHDFYLHSSGKISLHLENDDEEHMSWGLKEDWPVDSLFEPEKLIEKLINTLDARAEKNKEKLSKLTLLRNVLEKMEKIEEK